MPNKPMLIEHPIYIKGYDIDVMGIVSNIVYVRWFEDLRHVFLDKYYPFQEMIQSNKSPMLMKTEIEYKAPLTIYDKPCGRCWVSQMGKTKWEIEFEIVTGETVHCTGKQIGCFFDLESKRPARLPQRMIDDFHKEIPA